MPKLPNLTDFGERWRLRCSMSIIERSSRTTRIIMPKKYTKTNNHAKKRHTRPATVKAMQQIGRPRVAHVATRNDRKDLFDTAGRIAGNALALGSIAVASPFIFFVQAVLTSLDNIFLSGVSIVTS